MVWTCCGSTRFSCFFILCFICVVCVNKYVLSVLKFQFATIFQGWQTMFGAAALFSLHITGGMKPLFYNFTPGHSRSMFATEIVRCLPEMITFTAAIYSGSKALTVLPIPIFLVVENLPILAQTTFTSLDGTSMRHVPVTKYVLVMAACVSAVFVCYSDPMASTHYLGYRWMAIHVVTILLLGVFGARSVQGQLSEIDVLFLKYGFSASVLLPFSLYLGDVIAAQTFPYLYFYRFYAGCLLSGVFGVAINIMVSKLNSEDVVLSKQELTAFAKVLTAMTAIYLFNDSDALKSHVAHCFWLVCSLLTNVFVASSWKAAKERESPAVTPPSPQATIL